jgi:protein-tyrosine kinase
MNLIEQATLRLEELRQAGIEVPVVGPAIALAPAPLQRDSGPSTPAPSAAFLRPGRSARGADRPARPIEIDLDRLATEGYLTPHLSNRALAEEFRVIKMQLIKNVEAAAARGLRRNLILVTSSVPGEGKTFFSMNLAMSLAMEVDYHALLVDADVLRPSVMGRYGVATDLGLLDLATRDDLDVSDVLLRTNVPKLTLLPAGTPNHKSPELLASGYMDSLLAELAERYSDRLVIFDAPPILVASGARHLASRVGQVVMVVQADSTGSNTVSQAFAAVETCPLVSSVLNRCPRTASTAYGYYET